MLPDYFYEIPASSTGKYHPDFSLGEGGLVRHVKVAVRLAKELLDNPCIGDKYTNNEKDIMIFTLILHDGLKSGPSVLQEYAGERIVAWLDKDYSPLDARWQTNNSLYAIGSGGILGLGLGQGRQKYLYLPEEHNDFIFSVVCEELGFVGAILIIILFAMLIVRGYWLALHARDRYGALVITGLTSLLALQVFLNIAVVTNLVPCTGISLPFFSYGGTALWMQLVEIGIILSISRDIPLKVKKRKGEEK